MGAVVEDHQTAVGFGKLRVPVVPPHELDAWAKTEDYWDAHFRSLEEIHRAFAEDGVTMTYNHLNVHIL